MKYTKELIRKAYKKLKCSVYFDKTQLILRQQIVDFESSDIEKKLDKIYEALESAEKWEELQSNILGGISFHTFPKKLEDPEPGKSGDERTAGKAVLITNHVPDETRVKDVQYFINMSVEGHILGVLWLLSVGWILDDALYDKSYGNRLRKLMIKELKEEQDLSFSPYLFEPYFQQYESWRDSALEFAQNSINKNQDVIVFTMDFERYFYSVDLNGEVFQEIERLIEAAYGDGKNESTGLPVLIEKKYAVMLNSFVKSVIEKYSVLFSEEYKGRRILPIGFLPSNVLGNWCLKKFDKAVTDGWNPLYFGRYVDDIIIVDKIEKNSEIYVKVSNGTLRADELLAYYLTQCSRWNSIMGDFACDGKFALFEAGEGESPRFTLNHRYDISENSKSDIGLQNKKVKVFYFRHGESNAILQCFRNHIMHNKSEFRFLPEDEAVFDANDYSEIYDIDNKESINKLRGVDGISIDKFALSKLLGKYMRISGLINDRVETRFAQDIAKIYDNHVIIDNYVTWEKVIEIFVVNDQWRALSTFLDRIFSAISKTKYCFEGKTDSMLQHSMKEYLYSAWVRALALVWGARVGKHIEAYCKKFNKVTLEVLEDRRRYLRTRMYDKYMVPVLLDVLNENWIEAADDRKEVCLLDFSTVTDMALEQNCDYQYYPYMVTMYDLYIMRIVSWELKKEIHLAGGTEGWSIETIKKQYTEINFCIKERTLKDAVFAWKLEEFGGKAQLISVNGEKHHKLKIAVANLEMKHDNFKKLVQGSPNRSYARYKGISHIVNCAIAEKSDMLVLPEASIPIEWLATVVRTCAKNDMALIAGIEHIIYKDRVYNYTAVILPYEEEGYRCAVLSMHLKNHYAPQEKEDIHGYRLTEENGSGYELYQWKDCWFSVYCCFELACITDRALFSSYADMVVAVEWNRDTNYYSSILESLSRDLHCYCVQVNSSDYGDSRITMPSRTEVKDILKTKGGNNDTVLVGTIDVEKLREFQFKEYNLQKLDKSFKPTPPLFDKEIIRKKIQGILIQDLIR